MAGETKHLYKVASCKTTRSVVSDLTMSYGNSWLKIRAQNSFFKMGLHVLLLGLLLIDIDSSYAQEDLVPVLNVTEEYIDVPLNTVYYLKCAGNSPLVWRYQFPWGNEPRILNAHHEVVSDRNGKPFFQSIVKLDFKSYTDTGTYSCAHEGSSNEKSMASLYVFVNDLDHLLLPVDDMFFEILVIMEGQRVRNPCFPTISAASVTLWKNDCGEESVPTNLVSYQPTKGLIITRATKYFHGKFCCLAKMNGSEARFTVVFDYNAHTQLIPQVHIDARDAAYVVLNSSFTLTCVVTVETGTFIYTKWSYPKSDDRRFHIEPIKQNSSLSQGRLETYTQKLTVTDVQKEDKGLYLCNVSDHSNKTNYYEVLVNVYDRWTEPVVTFHLTDSSLPLIAEKGESKKFSVNYTVFPPYEDKNLYWMKDGLPISNRTGKHVILQTSKIATLVVYNLERSDSGAYTLVLETAGMMRDFSIEFKVKDKPRLTVLKPESCCYMSGRNYHLRCISEGFPRPNITWIWKPHCESKCDSVELSESDYKPNNLTNALNVTKSTWDANDTIVTDLFVKAEVSGRYFCRSANEMGKTKEKVPFIVTDVKDGFGITSETFDPIESDPYLLKCSANKLLYKNLEMSWTPSAANSSIAFENHTLEHSESQLSWVLKLTFDAITFNQSGTYECSASCKNDSLGVNKTSVFINVRRLEKPSFSYTNMNSSDVEVYPDEEFKLFCYVNGVPKPEVTWYRNGKPLNPDTSPVKFVDDFQVLIISRIVADDDGVYECRARNKIGTVSLNTTLNVIVTAPLKKGHSTIDPVKQIVIYTILAVGGVSTLILMFILVRRFYRHKRRQKQLQLFNHKVFEEGQLSLFNPDLPLDDQAELLPYDARWEFPKDQLKFGRTLGQGAFGRVVKAEAVGLNDYETSTTVAVKMLKERADVTQQKALMAELKILIHLGHHVNIVNLLGAVTKDIPKGELMVIVEYCRYGNLRQYLLKYRDKFIPQEDFLCSEKIQYAKQHLNTLSRSYSNVSDADRSPSTSDQLSPMSPVSPGTSVENRSYELFKSFSSNSHNTTGSSASDSGRTYVRVDSKEHCITAGDLICFAFQCARAMEYLASKKLIHRDLAARNVLLAEDNVVKVCDFGLAKDCYKYSNYVKKGDGPLPVKWMAIESIGDKVFTTKSDVWSFGVLLWEFFTLGGNPYPGAQVDEDFYRRLKQGYRMKKPEFAPDVIYQIMRDCWRSKPADRPDFTQLANALGELLESSLKQHYMELNGPYMEMNQQNLDHSYLNITKDEGKAPTADYVNSQVSMRTDGYDNVPPVRYSMGEKIPKSPMEVVPMIHFAEDTRTTDEIAKPFQTEDATRNQPSSCSTDYLCMGQRHLSDADDSVFLDSNLKSP